MDNKKDGLNRNHIVSRLNKGYSVNIEGWRNYRFMNLGKGLTLRIVVYKMHGNDLLPIEDLDRGIVLDFLRRLCKKNNYGISPKDNRDKISLEYTLAPSVQIKAERKLAEGWYK